MVPAFRLRTINPTISNRTTVRTETNPPMAQQEIKLGKRKFQDIHIPYAPEWGSRYQIKTIGPLNGSLYSRGRARFRSRGVPLYWGCFCLDHVGAFALSCSLSLVKEDFCALLLFRVLRDIHQLPSSFIRMLEKYDLFKEKKKNNITMPKIKIQQSMLNHSSEDPGSTVTDSTASSSKWLLQEQC